MSRWRLWFQTWLHNSTTCIPQRGRVPTGCRCCQLHGTFNKKERSISVQHCMGLMLMQSNFSTLKACNCQKTNCYHEIVTESSMCISVRFTLTTMSTKQCHRIKQWLFSPRLTVDQFEILHTVIGQDRSATVGCRWQAAHLSNFSVTNPFPNQWYQLQAD